MSPFTTLSTFFLLATLAVAAPAFEIDNVEVARTLKPRPGPSVPDLGCLNTLKCKQPAISATPVGQVAAVPATVTTIVASMVGRGIQNYTCTGGVFVSAGALANLYDASCVPVAMQASLPALALKTLSYPAGKVSGLGLTPPIAMDHWFTKNPVTGTGINPVFGKHTANPAFTVYAKAASIPAPDNSTANVAWLQLNTLQDGPNGALSEVAWRVNTVAGVAPASCSVEGSTISVQYATMYYFAN